MKRKQIVRDIIPHGFIKKDNVFMNVMKCSMVFVLFLSMIFANFSIVLAVSNSIQPEPTEWSTCVDGQKIRTVWNCMKAGTEDDVCYEWAEQEESIVCRVLDPQIIVVPEPEPTEWSICVDGQKTRTVWNCMKAGIDNDVCYEWAKQKETGLCNNKPTAKEYPANPNEPIDDPTLNSTPDNNDGHPELTDPQYPTGRNVSPIANAGVDQVVNENDLVTLNGSASSDINGDSLIYSWTAPAGITLSDSTAKKPTFTAPDVNSNTDYTFSLVVHDGTIDSDPDEVIVTVNNVPAGGGGHTTYYCNPRNVDNGTISSYPSCTITCNEGYSLEDNACVVSTDTEEPIVDENGEVLGEKVSGLVDGLFRCEDHKIFSIKDNVKTYVPDWKTLFENYLGEKINYATCEDIASIPEVLGDNTKKECVVDRKFVNGELIRGSNMRIYVIKNGQKVYISSLEELARDYLGKEIFNVCDDVLELY